MSFRSLNEFVRVLEQRGELLRVREFVSPRLEITEVADRMVKNGGKALLFENTGTQFPLLINSFASDRRICLALGVEKLTDIESELEHLMKAFTSPKNGFLDKLKLLPALKNVASWMPKPVRGRGACQEVVMEHPDLTRLPVMTCWPADGGPFITLPAVHTIDPVSRIRNLGMYRMQVFSPDMTGMHWHLHKGSAHHYHRYQELRKRMPVTVTLGGDPVYTYAATAPLPNDLDEYLLAGFLRKRRVELVKCLTNELEVPADVDFVIEGYVDPGEELILEGPFGDHTGFYSLADYFPRFHVTCITHRRDAIYPSTIVGIPPQEDGWIGKATERIFIMPIRMTVVPELADMHMPVEGVFHNITLTSIRKTYPGQAPKIMSSLWGAGQMMFNKIMAVTDADIVLTDYRAVAQTISANVDPLADIHFLRGPVDILDHSSSRYAYGSKMGIDATRKLPVELPSPARGGVRGGVDSRPPPPAPPPQGEGSTPTPGHSQPGNEQYLLNTSLLQEKISVLIVAVKKTKEQTVRKIASMLLSQEVTRNVKFFLFVDHLVDIQSLSQVVWIAANNIDPLRDCFFIDQSPGVKYPALFIDATRKTTDVDNFQRDWPNVTVMDDQTIQTINEKWPNLDLGQIISSPSDQYKSLNINEGAICKPF